MPLAVAVSGANMHDSRALKPLIRGIPAVRSRRGPQRRRPVELHADKAYFSAEHRARLRERGLVAPNARPGIESGERLGRHRWKIERSIAWLLGHLRLTVRYERKGSPFLAFLGLAATLTCYNSGPRPDCQARDVPVPEPSSDGPRPLREALLDVGVDADLAAIGHSTRTSTTAPFRIGHVTHAELYRCPDPVAVVSYG
ncbi:transposase [Streptomyces sp. NPDC048644]|uniref:transposase n=1 Tax=Streptomyces sp. NPDC048644 TaxID=3365582 RepID=UPI003717C61A